MVFYQAFIKLRDRIKLLKYLPTAGVGGREEREETVKPFIPAQSRPPLVLFFYLLSKSTTILSIIVAALIGAPGVTDFKRLNFNFNMFPMVEGSAPNRSL